MLRLVPLLSSLASLLVASSALAFDLQGHRGARGLMPENTLPAFAKALSIGVTTLELDTGITKDGKVVIAHDQRLSADMTRDADGQWIVDESPPINTLTLKEIHKYDVGRAKPGSRTSARFPEQAGVDNTRIPTLEEVFKLVKKSGNRAVRFNIETKIDPLKPSLTVDPETFAKAVVDVVREHGLESQVSIQSFDWRTLQVIQKTATEIQTVYLTAQQGWLDNVASSGGKASPWTAGFDIAAYNNDIPEMVKAAGGTVWSPFADDIDKTKIDRAHRLGLQVIPWTVNDEADMRTLITLGVDGIISDYPDRLRKVMAEKGMDLPKPAQVQP